MQISNSNAHAAIITNRTNHSSKASVKAVNENRGHNPDQEQISRQKAAKTPDKALVYEYRAIGNKGGPETIVSEFGANLSHTEDNGTKVRGNIVSENQNLVIANALASYSQHENLEQSDQVSQVMGIDLYA